MGQQYQLTDEDIANLSQMMLYQNAYQGQQQFDLSNREFDLGNKALSEGDYATAARHYEVFLAVLPQSAPAHMNLAVARHRQAVERLGSDQRWKRTTDLDPDSRAKAIELHSAGSGGKLDPRLDKARLKEAAAEYKTALRLDPSYTLARVNYGALLLDLGRAKDAQKVLEAATRKASKSAGAWNNLGVAYAVNGDAKKAAAAFDKAAQLDAKLADPWFNLGALYAASKDAKEQGKAVDAWDQYVERDAASGWAKRVRALKADFLSKPAKKK